MWDYVKLQDTRMAVIVIYLPTDLYNTQMSSDEGSNCSNIT